MCGCSNFSFIVDGVGQDKSGVWLKESVDREINARVWPRPDNDWSIAEPRKTMSSRLRSCSFFLSPH